MKAIQFLYKNIDLISIASSRLFVIIFQLFSIKIFTHYLSLEELGYYYFFISCSYFFNAFFFVPSDFYQQKIITNNKDRLRFKKIFTFNLFLLKTILIPYTLGYFFLNCFVDVTLFTYFLICLLSISTYFVQLFRNFINNLGFKRFVAFNFFLESFVKIILLLLGFYLSSNLNIDNANLLLFLICVSSIISFLHLFIQYHFKVHNFFCGKTNFYFKKYFSFSFPLSLSSIMNWIISQSYRILLILFGYAELIGIFVTLSNIGSAGALAIASIFNQNFIPKIYSTKGGFIYIFMKYFVLVFTVSSIVILIFKDFIINIITKESFSVNSIYLFNGFIVESLNVLIGAICIYFTLKNNNRFTVISYLLGTIYFLFILCIFIYFNSINFDSLLFLIITTHFFIFIFMLSKLRLNYAK
jgi:O-antigen/teichoic acid export membrane protein